MSKFRAVLVAIVGLSVITVGASAGQASGPAGSSKQGDPIKVMTIGPFDVPAAGTVTPELYGAVNAHFKPINKAGGVKDANGVRHKVEVIVCKDGSDVNKAAQCGRDAVDQGVVAVTGGQGTQGYVAPLAAAGIPVIASIGGGAELATSPVAFPFMNSIATYSAGPFVLARAGAKKIAIIYPGDLPGVSPLLARGFTSGAALAKLEAGPIVPVARDVVDYGPAVAAATTAGVDGIIAIALGPGQGTLIRQLRSAGFKGKIATVGFFVTTELIEDLGKDAQGLLVSLAYPAIGTKGIPGLEKFKREMAAYDKKLALTDGAVNFWLAARVFERVAATLPVIDRKSVLAAMNALNNFDTEGLTPPISFTTPGPAPFVRIVNPTVAAGKVKGKTVVPVVNGFIDPATGVVTPFVKSK